MAGSPWGGSEELWSQAALRLAKMGHVVTASVCYWPERIEALERLRKAGSRIFRRRPRHLADPLLKRFIRNPETWKARRWLQEADPNLVVLSCGDFAPDLSWCDACRQLGIPYATIAQSATEVPVAFRRGCVPDAGGIWESAKLVFCLKRKRSPR